jgi:hypothetical protein
MTQQQTEQYSELMNTVASAAGLPDFSWYKIPKRKIYAKLPRTIPNVHKI